MDTLLHVQGSFDDDDNQLIVLMMTTERANILDTSLVIKPWLCRRCRRTLDTLPTKPHPQSLAHKASPTKPRLCHRCRRTLDTSAHAALAVP